MNDGDLLLEIIARMAKGEKGLHLKRLETRQYGQLLIARLDTLPALSKIGLVRAVKAKKWVKFKTVQRNNHSICVLRRPDGT